MCLCLWWCVCNMCVCVFVCVWLYYIIVHLLPIRKVIFISNLLHSSQTDIIISCLLQVFQVFVIYIRIIYDCHILLWMCWMAEQKSFACPPSNIISHTTEHRINAILSYLTTFTELDNVVNKKVMQYPKYTISCFYQMKFINMLSFFDADHR